jgi:WD40 repeat protein
LAVNCPEPLMIRSIIAKTSIFLVLGALCWAVSPAVGDDIPGGGVVLENNVQPPGQQYIGVNTAAFSPDGKLLACQTVAGINFWDTATLKLLDTLKWDRADQAFGLVFSKDGKLLATGDYDGNARIFDVAARKQLFLLKVSAQRQGIVVAGFIEGNKAPILVTVSRTIQFWDASTGLSTGTLRRASELINTPLLDEGRFLLIDQTQPPMGPGAAAQQDLTAVRRRRSNCGLECWDLVTRTCIPEQLDMSQGNFFGFPNWYFLLDNTRHLALSNQEGNLGLWTQPGGKYEGAIRLGGWLHFVRHAGSRVAFVSSDSQLSKARTVGVIDLEPARPVAQYVLPEASSAVISPDGGFLLALRTYKDPVIWTLPKK